MRLHHTRSAPERRIAHSVFHAPGESRGTGEKGTHVRAAEEFSCTIATPDVSSGSQMNCPSNGSSNRKSAECTVGGLILVRLRIAVWFAYISSLIQINASTLRYYFLRFTATFKHYCWFLLHFCRTSFRVATKMPQIFQITANIEAMKLWHICCNNKSIRQRLSIRRIA